MNQPLKLGIAGLGNVGTGLLQLLGEHGQRLARNRDSTGRGYQQAGREPQDGCLVPGRVTVAGQEVAGATVARMARLRSPGESCSPRRRT